MRIKDRTAQTLVDLPILQADRLQNPHFARALQTGTFDPFPDGTHATGTQERRGTLAQNSGITEAAISGAALTAFDGALPDHIQHALQKGLHSDDNGLQAFLALFDRRLMQLQLKAERAAVLVATQDETGRQVASILSRFLRLIGRPDADYRYLKLLLPLLSRVRSLEGLRNVVGWWTQRSTRVTSAFDMYYPIDADSRSRLSADGANASPLGKGALLGRFGRIPSGRISVYIECETYSDFNSLVEDKENLAELRSAVAQYLREPVVVSFFADVPRGVIAAPKLSARAHKADRLGAYNMLTPEKTPQERAFLKLPETVA